MLHRRLEAPVLIAAVILCGKPGCADPPAPPPALRCAFSSHVSTVSKGPTSFSTRTMSAGGIDPLTFTEIDGTAGTARLTNDAGTSTVTLIATAAAWTFIAVTDTGNVTMTQIFPGDQPDRASVGYRAVHARQSIAHGAIVGSQHYGLCKAPD